MKLTFVYFYLHLYISIKSCFVSPIALFFLLLTLFLLKCSENESSVNSNLSDISLILHAFRFPFYILSKILLCVPPKMQIKAYLDLYLDLYLC